MDLQAQVELTTRAARAVAHAASAAAGDAWQRADLEWSQAGTQHSGRLAISEGHEQTRRIPVPDEAVLALAELRAAMAGPGQGTWFSAFLTVAPDARHEAHFNYTERPYWNATGATMLEAPADPPVPSEDRWLADLRRFPRDREHVPAWLAPDAIDGEAIARLRAALDGIGHPRGGVVLPGEATAIPPLEGTVEIVKHGPGHFALQIADYGQREFLTEFRTEYEACQALWQYVAAPLPQAIPTTLADLHHRAQASAASYRDLAQRLEQAGQGGIITNLAPGVPYDRIGTLDGLYFFGWNTPWEQRSLPESARGAGSTQVTFVARQPIEIQAELVAGWFGQPGGAIRFRVEDRHQGVRDLVRTGALSLVHVTA